MGARGKRPLYGAMKTLAVRVPTAWYDWIREVSVHRGVDQTVVARDVVRAGLQARRLYAQNIHTLRTALRQDASRRRARAREMPDEEAPMSAADAFARIVSGSAAKAVDDVLTASERAKAEVLLEELWTAYEDLLLGRHRSAWALDSGEVEPGSLDYTVFQRDLVEARPERRRYAEATLPSDLGQAAPGGGSA